MDELRKVAKHNYGVVRALRTGLTLRSGWMSMQDQTACENVLHPIAATGWHVSVVLSDKQRGLVPAIHTTFPHAKHALCQSHYLKNLAEPIAAADETMKVQLRKKIRGSVGQVIRAEHVDHPGVLTVTGLLPSTPELSPGDRESVFPQPPQPQRVETPEDETNEDEDEEKEQEEEKKNEAEDNQRTPRTLLLTSEMRL